MIICDKDFFNQPAETLAPKLLGMFLCRRTDGGVIRARITEVEAYCGLDDSACHSARGKTERTKVMWEEGGTIYVYLCYGMHNMLNIVCAGNSPEAVLIRGVEGVSGPGRVTKHFFIDRAFNGIDIKDSNLIWIESGQGPKKIYSGKRIGIDYADKKDRLAHLRFWCD